MKKTSREIGPPRPDRSSMLGGAHLAEAVRKGWVTTAFDAPVPRKPVMPYEELAQELDVDRADR